MAVSNYNEDSTTATWQSLSEDSRAVHGSHLLSCEDSRAVTWQSVTGENSGSITF